MFDCSTVKNVAMHAHHGACIAIYLFTPDFYLNRLVMILTAIGVAVPPRKRALVLLSS